jgi:hypothetical protein
VMHAGTIYGIEVGDEFTLYEHDDPSRKSSPLGILVVHDVRSFRSTMTPLPGASRFELHKSAFALQTKAGNEHDLRTYAAEHKEYTSFFEALAQKLKHACSDHPSTLQVEKEKARLSIDLDLEKMVFNILDERVTAFLNSQDIPSFVELNMSKLHSPAILDAAAHFHWHFCHTNKHHKLQNKVRLEFTQVKIEEDEDLNPVIEPTGDNLNQNGVINLVPGAQEYGVKICNDSPVPLYAALFYFDINDFSISTCIQCTHRGNY